MQKNTTGDKQGYSSWLKQLVYFILFGNYFLAFCIVALSVETNFKNGFTIKSAFYYASVFLSVVVYYTHAYLSEDTDTTYMNIRSRWYFQNKKLIFATQLIYTVALIFLLCMLTIQYFHSFQALSLYEWVLLSIFPGIAFLYYTIVFPASFRFRLRNVAWLKPFIIGFVCTGAIVIYPFVFHHIEQQTDFHVSLESGCYFLTNWLFTTAIAIMFDIKDFVADHNYHLKTFVVTKGLRRTIFSILLPLSSVSYLSFIVFAFIRHFSFLQVAVNTIPFLLLLMVSASLRRRRGILYYLIVIDGLLLVKALFGIITMTFAE